MPNCYTDFINSQAKKVKFKKFTAIFVLLAFLLPLFSHAQKVGWVTDIHAGSTKKKKKSATNIFYPRYYRQYLAQALTEMKNEGIELLIISGDITDHGRQTRYAKRVENLVKEKGMELVWARGNHDDEETVEKYTHQKNSYYYIDKYGWRIIALDNSQRLAVKEGGMRSTQKEWLEELLEDTDEPILAVMHYPIFAKDGSSVYKTYREMESWFSGADTVKMALAGHWHTEYFTTYHGVKYAVGNPITLESKMGSYYVIDLDTLWIDARQATVSQELKKKMRSGRI
ncbi:MAG: metallophosphoesterase [Patescibacteria group bacterium]|nr:metallophosphoesterase [Patescibacteria group bacterium]